MGMLWAGLVTQRGFACKKDSLGARKRENGWEGEVEVGWWILGGIDGDEGGLMRSKSIVYMCEILKQWIKKEITSRANMNLEGAESINKNYEVRLLKLLSLCFLAYLSLSTCIYSLYVHLHGPRPVSWLTPCPGHWISKFHISWL